MHIPGSTRSADYAAEYARDQVKALEKQMQEIKEKNPQPDKWEYIQHYVAGEYIALELKYIGCTNYEGRKILVCRCKERDFMFKKPNIDPHFCDKPNNTIHPIARFEPTKSGWLDAKEFAYRKSQSGE